VSATVKSCLEKNDKKLGKFYEVECDETILFPEGGGQPTDFGTLNDIPVSNVYHTSDGRVAHRTAAPIQVGTTVQMAVDWTRRFDHMQQHSCQHLLSALAFRRFGWITHSWWLSSWPEPCHIEFGTSIIKDEVCLFDLFPSLKGSENFTPCFCLPCNRTANGRARGRGQPVHSRRCGDENTLV
jgi:Ser-tRNA(Ala) deacylase AlaX